MPLIIEFDQDCWDPAENKFISNQRLVLEHSLLSLTKWEQHFKKPFISKEGKSVEEFVYYVKCMTLNSDEVNPIIYSLLTPEIVEQIDNYMQDPMTATKFYDNSVPHGRNSIVTSELIYYAMFSYGIPLEFETRHLNWLIALIRTFSLKQGKQKKMSKSEATALQYSINEKRLASKKG